MYNSNKPDFSDLPTSKQLVRSTCVALIAAIAILVAIVLPAEYAIDPIGIGRALGLTEMGEIKTQLAQEAAADAKADNAASTASAATSSATTATTANTQSTTADAWRDEMKVVLQPGQGAEVKLSMRAGEQAHYHWLSEGGVVNFDTHGDSGSGQSISYEKGRGAPAGEGAIEAAFDGNHGWFWRNRGNVEVTVVVRARGQYAEMKRVM